MEPRPLTTVQQRLERAVRKVQADARVPALSVALHRADREPWTCTVGNSGDPDRPLDAGTRFRIGSVTKTLTAVLVLQARDDGLLDLDDPVAAHLDVPAHGTATIRGLLSHTAGYQREPYGDVWDVLTAPDDRQLLDDLARAERVLPNNRRFHYSNLGLAVLGQLVAELRGGTWASVLQEHASSTRSASPPPPSSPPPRRPSATWSTRTPTPPGPSRSSTSAASARPPSSGAPPATWPAGRRSWPDPSSSTPTRRCSPRPPSTRCAGRRPPPTRPSGPAASASA